MIWVSLLKSTHESTTMVAGKDGWETPGVCATFVTVGDMVAWACSEFCPYKANYTTYLWCIPNNPQEGWHEINSDTNLQYIQYNMGSSGGSGSSSGGDIVISAWYQGDSKYHAHDDYFLVRTAL